RDGEGFAWGRYDDSGGNKYLFQLDPYGLKTLRRITLTNGGSYLGWIAETNELIWLVSSSDPVTFAK
ncbi:MAG: hypothetical protein GWN84_13160, partial [Gammaproteobacteria bacterium]|nr:hypothetical protein [Gammaproteobacteria bacterium]NIR30231.1 hypothetical protein [Gammaproteobacteria bacterium]NIR83778.1 hypothetical protein [Gammaproteobacteria bacterium]NIU05101.1 hypothetical protein [Gammaproteobacteria bacterium]NIV50642.1 hypothetical protein [Gammaproteobacteria bacterium]